MKKLNFGCGTKIKPKEKGWVNADIQKARGIDKNFNFDKFPYPFKDNVFDYILVDNVMEHLSDPIKVIDELHRIGKKGGIIEILVPYWKAEGAYNDPTHKVFFNKQAIRVLCGLVGYSHAKKKFKILENKRYSTNKLRYIPSFIRKILDYFILNQFTGIRTKIKILK